MIVPTCRELIEFLDDYVDHRLSLARKLAFEVHLAGCRDCRAYLSSYRATIKLAKASGGAPEAPPMPPELTRAILKSMMETGR